MRLITRSQWGAQPRGNGAATPFEPRGVTVHWEGAGWPWPWEHSTCDDKVRQIQSFHMDDRGWSDIAYNFVVCPHRYVYEGRGLNRRSAANGDWEVNTYWYAVCGLWGTKSGEPVPDLLHAYRDAIDHCRAKGGAGAKLNGHRDHKSTACPGDDLYAWVRAGAPRPAQKEDVEMQLNDRVKLPKWVVERWPDDRGLADGKIAVNTALGSGYGHARLARENTTKILALVEAQSATIDKLVDALALPARDVEALKQVIRDEFAKITLRFGHEEEAE